MNSLPNQKTDETKSEETFREELAILDVKRKSVEHEADAIFLELTTPPEEGVTPMGIDTPLVDQDGYPRADIDIYRTRTMRRRFRTLTTDHKEITAKIESLLLQLAAIKNPIKSTEEMKEHETRMLPKPKPKYDPVTGKWVVMNWNGTIAGIPGGDLRSFSELDQLSGMTGETELGHDDGANSIVSSLVNSTRSASTADNEPRPPVEVLPRSTTGLKPPFARIDAIAAGSPAEHAGLKEEDLIVAFGPIHADDNEHLRAIAQLVPEVASEHGSIEIFLLRRKIEENEWESLTMKLSPRPWAGSGLLGCHLMPYTAHALS